VTGPDAVTRAALDARLASAQASSRLPSVVAGLVRDGALVWSGGAGEVADDGGTRRPDADVQYRCGSITKTFVAVTVLQLRDEGRLDLADPVRQHLPEPDLGAATVGQLLSQSSGLRAETAGPWWERTPGGPFRDLVDGSLGDGALLTRAGRRFHYSNVGFAVLGELVARLRGRPWSQVLQEGVLDPFGLGRTTSRPQAPAAEGLAVHPYADLVLPEPEHDAGAMAPAGQLWSTVTDLGRWAAFLGGAVPGPLTAETLEEMREPLALVDLPGQPWTSAYGLGLQVWNENGRRAVGHGGSMPGFLAVLRAEVAGEQAGDAVVVAANTTAGLSPTLGRELLEDLHRGWPRVPPPWRPQETPDPVLDLLGTWFWGPAAMVLRAAGDGWLALEPPDSPGRASRLRPVGAGEWEGLDGYFAGERLTVVRDGDGRARQLEIASFVLTRTPYDPATGVPGGVDPGGWRPTGP
jgi:CubicO group peptidase (beta-lactamase class C family)